MSATPAAPPSLGPLRPDAPRVAVIDDDPGILSTVRRALGVRGFDVVTFGEPIPALADLEHDARIAAVLLDVGLPGMSGLELLAHLKETRRDLEVIMMTADDSAQTAVQALKLGAYDYLTKPFADIETVLASVSRAVERHQLLSRNQLLERRVDVAERFPGLVTRSVAMRNALALVEQVSQTDATVLLRGESGVGKELFARLIHAGSGRARAPFIAVTCSGLPEGLLDSELFGHLRGAFTGAQGARKGVFEEASGGTLFLDEIGDAPAATQIKLLRALQEKEIRPLGSSSPKKVDTRVVAATNVDLEAAIAGGRFREDLYFRLNVFTVVLPPLRERMEDVPALVEYFVGKYAAQHRRPVRRVSSAAMEALLTHRWPGNVRELEHAIERAVIVTHGEEIGVAALPDGARPARRQTEGREATATSAPAMTAAAGPAPEVGSALFALPFSRAKTLATTAFEKAYAEHALAQAKGNLSAAARAAGLDRSNFRRLLARHGLARRDSGDEET